MNRDYTIYPESYPVFNHPRKYLLRNHITTLDNKPEKIRKIVKSPGFNRICDVRYSVEPENDSINLPELSYPKPNSSLGNYQISHYPTSPLNPELVQQCTLLQIFKNMKYFPIKKPKIKNKEKIVPKIRKIKFEPEFKKVGKIDVMAQKELVCEECRNSRCICFSSDKAPEKVFNKIGINLESDVGSRRNVNCYYSVSPKVKYNKMKQDFISRTTKRKRKNTSMDIESIRRSLLVTPFRSFSKNEDF